MPSDVHRIDVRRIDAGDVSYQVSCDRDDRLSESIRCVGLLQPVRLLDSGGRLIILSGFRRIAVHCALGLAEIDARVYRPADADARRRCLMAIGDNSTQRPLNPVESARAVALLVKEIAEPAAVRECLGALLLPDNLSWVDQQLSLAALAADIQKLLQDGVVGTAMALELGALEATDAAAVGRLFAALRLSLNRQREVLGTCRDLSRSSGRSIRQILEGPVLGALLDDVHSDIGVKTHGLRRQLKRMRYPGLVAAEADFNKSLKALGLGQEMRLDPPPFFEGTTYKMTLSFSSVETLERQLDELRTKASSPHLSRILERPAD